MSPSLTPVRRAALALLLVGSLTFGLAACGSQGRAGAGPKGTSAAVAAVSPSPSTSAQKQKFAKTRFVANAGLAAGATYQWIVKPYRAGKFKKGTHGRTRTLIKAGLAGAFTYNRLKAALANAKGDPTLAKAVAPLTAGVAGLKGIAGRLRKGQAGRSEVGAFDDVISNVKKAGKDSGAEVKNKVPSTSELAG